jgi:hypothetical protein
MYSSIQELAILSETMLTSWHQFNWHGYINSVSINALIIERSYVQTAFCMASYITGLAS